MAYSTLNEKYQKRHLEIDFKDLVERSEKLQTNISSIVGRDLGVFLLPRVSKNVDHKSKNKYSVMNEKEKYMNLWI